MLLIQKSTHVIYYHSLLLKVLIEPLHSLVKGLLLGELLLLLAQIHPDGKAVLNMTEQIDLV